MLEQGPETPFARARWPVVMSATADSSASTKVERAPGLGKRELCFRGLLRGLDNRKLIAVCSLRCSMYDIALAWEGA